MRALDVLSALPDAELHRRVGEGPARREVQFLLYAALRREQAAACDVRASDAAEPAAILAFAQAAYRELAALLGGRHVDILDAARDGDWSLRDLLRHAIAVELRYREQVRWSATRRDADPLAIPDGRLPCDRRSPPEPEFADARTGDVARVLQLLGDARAGTDAALAHLGREALARPSLWGEVRVDVRDRMLQIGVHLVEVVVQTEKMLGLTADPEARRIARRIAQTRGLHESRSDPARLAALDAELEEIARASAIG